MIGKVLLQADLDYSYSPWKYHGDEVMVETTFDVSCLPIKKKLYLLTKYFLLILLLLFKHTAESIQNFNIIQQSYVQTK